MEQLLLCLQVSVNLYRDNHNQGFSKLRLNTPDVFKFYCYASSPVRHPITDEDWEEITKPNNE